jgi:transcriptional regulator GlxA family with amidase domain
VLELLSIQHDLSVSRNMRILSDITINNQESFSYNSRLIQKVMEYINKNLDEEVSLTEATRIAGMAEVAFSRFFKAAPVRPLSTHYTKYGWEMLRAC